MIALMKRILSVSGPYQGRIQAGLCLCVPEGHAVQGPHRVCPSWP